MGSGFALTASVARPVGASGPDVQLDPFEALCCASLAIDPSQWQSTERYPTVHEFVAEVRGFLAKTHSRVHMPLMLSVWLFEWLPWVMGYWSRLSRLSAAEAREVFSGLIQSDIRLVRTALMAIRSASGFLYHDDIVRVEGYTGPWVPESGLRKWPH